jgi:hypothetical protein
VQERGAWFRNCLTSFYITYTILYSNTILLSCRRYGEHA